MTRAEIVAKAGQVNAAKTIKTRRNDAMVDMADRGFSFGEIAERFKVSRARAHTIVKRERARRASAAA